MIRLVIQDLKINYKKPPLKITGASTKIEQKKRGTNVKLIVFLNYFINFFFIKSNLALYSIIRLFSSSFVGFSTCLANS
jgi:hypothetical protein